MPYNKIERRKLGYPVGKVLEKNSSGKMETVDYDSSTETGMTASILSPGEWKSLFSKNKKPVEKFYSSTGELEEMKELDQNENTKAEDFLLRTYY